MSAFGFGYQLLHVSPWPMLAGRTSARQLDGLTVISRLSHQGPPDLMMGVHSPDKWTAQPLGCLSGPFPIRPRRIVWTGSVRAGAVSSGYPEIRASIKSVRIPCSLDVCQHRRANIRAPVSADATPHIDMHFFDDMPGFGLHAVLTIREQNLRTGAIRSQELAPVVAEAVKAGRSGGRPCPCLLRNAYSERA
jgi:hypothetical protein